MNRSPQYRVGIGASSILMIFVVLSLTTLGVLSFASARANLHLTDRRQIQVESYYTAVAEAQALIARIDAALAQAAEDPDAYDAQVLALDDMDTRILVEEDRMVSFSLPVGDSQALNVRLAVAEAGDTPRYTMRTHELVNVTDWQPDYSMTLLATE